MDSAYATCTNENCPQFNIPMRPPRIQVEPADPDLVRRVRAVEDAEERERAWVREVERRIEAATWRFRACPPEKAYGENRWICYPDDAAQLERIIASVPK